jgi:hypothetical protein
MSTLAPPPPPPRGPGRMGQRAPPRGGGVAVVGRGVGWE